MASVSGGSGNDSLDGTAGSDEIYGGAGNDTLYGGASYDTLYGGDGNDTLFGGAGSYDDYFGGNGDDTIVTSDADDNWVYGGAGNDTITGGAGYDSIEGNAGNDSIAAGGGDDDVLGGSGDDQISGGTGNDMLQGDDGNDLLEGESGDDTLYGGAGNDTVFGGAGNDIIQGEEGDDTLYGDDGADTFRMLDMAGNDTIFGGSGGNDQDRLQFLAGTDVTVVFTGSEAGNYTQNAGGTQGTFTDIEVIETSGGNDTINAASSGAAAEVYSGTGNDTITGGSANDSLYSGAGNDTVYGGAGNDTVYGGDGTDTVYGDAGDDRLFGDAGNDRLLGGSGNDTVTGGDGADTLYGGTGSDTIFGGAGDDDFLLGNGDTAYGGDGDDEFYNYTGEGTGGTATIYGGEGNESNADPTNPLNGDTLILDWDANAGGLVTDNLVVTFSGTDAGTATGGRSTLNFFEIENVRTGAGNDNINASASSGPQHLDGGAGNDSVVGGSGQDTIFGGTGDDTLNGGAGNDTAYGGDGNDAIDGGFGNDRLFGGDGNDTILFGVGDWAVGGAGNDLFDLTDYGDTGTAPIDVAGGTGFDTLRLGTLANLGTLNITSDVGGSKSGTVVADNGSVINFSSIENIICFTPGTMIATPHGARAIETLKVGDQVVTRDHGLQPIRWIEQRTVPAQDRFAPIRIRPGVVTGQERDLLVSPQHRVLFQGYRAELLFGESEVLISAKHLIDGTLVTAEEGGDVTYVHMLFDEHEIIFAEGAATESFHPGGIGLSAVTEPAREELFAIFPQLRSDLGQYGSTARRCLKQFEADMVRLR